MPQIESLARSVFAQAVVHVEAYGIPAGIAVLPLENGDPDQQFGVIFRLSNKAFLTITQRPLEDGDVQIGQHP